MATPPTLPPLPALPLGPIREGDWAAVVAALQALQTYNALLRKTLLTLLAT
jgi:hypothetical protein